MNTTHPCADDSTVAEGPDTPERRRRGRSEHLRAAIGRLGGEHEHERGSATAEYAIVILAAVAFAGVLVAVMRSGAVASILEGLVTGALTS